MNRIIKYIKKRKIRLSLLTISLIWYALCLPSELFNEPTSTVILSKGQKLLGAKIAKDGQWRFPVNKEVPEKFKTCLSLKTSIFTSILGSILFPLQKHSMPIEKQERLSEVEVPSRNRSFDCREKELIERIGKK